MYICVLFTKTDTNNQKDRRYENKNIINERHNGLTTLRKRKIIKYGEKKKNDKAFHE